MVFDGPIPSFGTQSPITYLGPSREAERLLGPECRIERKFGADVSWDRGVEGLGGMDAVFLVGGPADGNPANAGHYCLGGPHAPVAKHA